MHRIYLLAIVLLLLSACATPSAQLPQAEPDNSHPTIASIYYYISGSLMHYEGNYQAADELYRLAQLQDKDSRQIPRQILINSGYAYINGQDIGEDVPAAFNAARKSMVFDQDLLKMAYSVYYEAQDSTGMQWAINESVARFPSSRAYLQKYFQQYLDEQKADEKLLQQAYKLAKGNADDLIYCANMYAMTDRNKALNIMKEAYALNPSAITAKMVNDLTIRQADDEEAAKLFSSYAYPQDKEAMKDFLQTANKTLKLKLVLSLADSILATSDTQLIAELAFAAYMRFDDSILLRCREATTNSIHTPEELAELAVFLFGQSLFSPAMGTALDYADLLHGSKDVDDMMLYHTLRFTLKLQNSAEADTEDYSDLQKACEKRLPDNPLSRYIISAHKDFLNPPDSLKALRTELSEYFVNRDQGYEEDWTSVISKYLLEGREQEKLFSLRKAVIRFHDNPVFLNDLGFSLLDYPDSLQEAGSLITKALELDPNNAYYHDSMAWFYMLSGYTQKAMEYIQIPMQMENLPGEIAYHIGFILEANNDLIRAKEYYIKALDDSVFPGFQEKAKQALQALQQR